MGVEMFHDRCREIQRTMADVIERSRSDTASAIEAATSGLYRRISDLESANDRLQDRIEEIRKAAAETEKELLDTIIALTNPGAAHILSSQNRNLQRPVQEMPALARADGSAGYRRFVGPAGGLRGTAPVSREDGILGGPAAEAALQDRARTLASMDPSFVPLVPDILPPPYNAPPGNPESE